ncbi:replication associated protein (plasmid) [Limosilactobacillus reuteri]|uniref:replication associated protein n=1 Tax=Limosilactobacillus reuteri TaxID=1598 RepID=UPI003D814740
MSKVIPTNHFKKQRKKVKKNPRWHSIFHGEVPFPDDHRSPWEYVINCFLNDKPIPDYFYEHSITLTAQQKSQIKNRLGSLSQVEIKGLDLHFDGRSTPRSWSIFFKISPRVFCFQPFLTKKHLKTLLYQHLFSYYKM